MFACKVAVHAQVSSCKVVCFAVLLNRYFNVCDIQSYQTC